MISLKYDQLQTLMAAHLFLCLRYFKNVSHKLFSPTHHLIQLIQYENELELIIFMFKVMVLN